MKVRTKTLVESALMIALATVLSLIKLADLPYGGSVTIASMLPIIIISYRHGLGIGLISGLTYGIIQQLLGLNTLSYVTTWQSVLAVILLDYIVAFMVLGLGGAFRNKTQKQSVGLALGAILVCILRYICHVISGATVWAGLSIPTAGALGYSLIYNATYMVPETIVTLIAALYLGSSLDFRGENLARISEKSKTTAPAMAIAGGLVLSGALIYDVIAIFAKLQNAETGEWSIIGLESVNWLVVGIVSVVGLVLGSILIIASKRKKVN